MKQYRVELTNIKWVGKDNPTEFTKVVEAASTEGAIAQVRHAAEASFYAMILQCTTKVTVVP